MRGRPPRSKRADTFVPDTTLFRFHPENFRMKGVEATAGPLGQGCAMAGGMAIAERHLNATFGDDLVDHHTWVLAGDGCLMEGLNHEAVGLEIGRAHV